jgi:cation:H+ antiporter
VSSARHPLVAVAGAFLLTAPWVGVQLLGVDLGNGATVAVSGVAVLGSSFLLAWAAETAEKDVPRAFAIAVLAILAVAPEYAVDALYAWNAGAQAGTDAGSEAANLAVANMTGANRILIGLGWSGIALMTVRLARKTADPAIQTRSGLLNDVVTLNRSISMEIAFLAMATLWAFFIPLGDGIDALDTLVLVGIYTTYILVVIFSGHQTAEEHVGVPHYFQAFPRPARVASVLTGFGYSGLMIFTAVEPFAHGLEEIGTSIGVPPFFMIQWIAPLASESPELIVVAVLVYKARSTAGFNALISSKLNQWTLLIGTLAVVYSIALGQYGALPFDEKQTLEIWITAGQSYFALAVLINLNISIREALTLLVLFVSQVVLEFLILRDYVALGVSSNDVLLGYTAVYLVLGTALFVRRRRDVGVILRLTAETVRKAIGRDSAPAGHADD